MAPFVAPSLARAQATPSPTPGRPTPRPTAPGTPAPTPRPTLVPPTPAPTATPAPAWVQALQPLTLWSGPDDAAEALGTAARWDYFLIARPQVGGRLLVVVGRTRGYAWVDALSVGPSGPPPPGWPPADLPPPSELSLGWISTVTDAPLWSDADAGILLGIAPPWTPFKQLEPQSGPRLHVQDLYSSAEAWIDAANAGPIDVAEPLSAPSRWWGISWVDGANVRPAPSTRVPALGELPRGLPIVVSGWVVGEEVIRDNPTWAALGPEAYIYSSTLRPVALPAAPPPPEAASRLTGRWIDLNLLHQVVVAYEGHTMVHLARTSTGRPDWETTPGVYEIQRRVEKETMDSESLIGRDAQRADYKVENVRWTQYFSSDGKALHENYWKPRDEFGIPSSHGCVGLVAEDAHFLWTWASIGVPVFAHY